MQNEFSTLEILAVLLVVSSAYCGWLTFTKSGYRFNESQFTRAIATGVIVGLTIIAISLTDVSGMDTWDRIVHQSIFFAVSSAPFILRAIARLMASEERRELDERLVR